MSTNCDTPNATATPAAQTTTGTPGSVSVEPPTRPPSPVSQHTEEGIRSERSIASPSSVPAAHLPIADVTAAEPGSYLLCSTSNSSAIAIPAPAAESTATATPVPPPPPDRRNPAQAAAPIPKYLDPEWIKTGIPDTKFYKDYPPDPWGQEAAPNARVWKIYRDEMTAADADTLKSWNDTIDVLLIFAGLFSAVSTAFIIESYKNLRPDYTQYIANVLYATAKSNRTVDGIISVLGDGFIGPPDSYVFPSATQRWTNGLWFTSLVVSLTAALLCILIKQWLDQYRARTKRAAQSLPAWARRHQLYYRGLRSWGVPTLISLLPLFLHVSLFLFFAGLVLFLQPLDSVIANTVLAILMLTLLFYVLSLVIPAFCIDCPSSTPLLLQARSLISVFLRLLARLSSLMASPYPCWPRSSNAVIARIKRKLSVVSYKLVKLLARSKQRFARETSTIEAYKFTLDGQALTTLIVSTNDPDIIDAGVEAVGALTAEATLEVLKRKGPIEIIADRTGQDLLIAGDAPSAFAVLTDARRRRTVCALHTRRELWLRRNRRKPALDRTLGLDGVMLQVMMHSLAESDSDILDAEGLLYRGLLHPQTSCRWLRPQTRRQAVSFRLGLLRARSKDSAMLPYDMIPEPFAPTR